MTDTLSSRATLRRALGLRTVVTTSTGLAFAALEYLAAAGLVVYVAGDSAWIPIIVAGALALLAYGFFGELNGMFPTAAAIRLYMKRAMDDRIALTITFTYLTTIVLVIASDAFIVGSALAHAFGEPAWVASIWIVGLLAIAVVTNLRGITVAGLLQDVATSVVVVATLAIGVLALVRSGHGLHTPFQPLHGHHPGDLLQAVALGVFLYSAFEWVTTSAEEVRKPSSINRGMLIAIGILCVVCAVATVAMSHTLSHHELTSAYPQLYLGVAALGSLGALGHGGGDGGHRAQHLQRRLHHCVTVHLRHRPRGLVAPRSWPNSTTAPCPGCPWWSSARSRRWWRSWSRSRTPGRSWWRWAPPWRG